MASEIGLPQFGHPYGRLPTAWPASPVFLSPRTVQSDAAFASVVHSGEIREPCVVGDLQYPVFLASVLVYPGSVRPEARRREGGERRAGRLVDADVESRKSFGVRRQRTLTRIAITAGGGVSIAVLHHITPHSSLLWHNVFQWLYYLPVVYASTHFGLWGGLGAAALAALGYIPHFLEAAEHTPDLIPVQFAEVAVLFLVSGVTGLLADREHRQRDRLQKATEELQRLHEELQGSFEHLRRADRLAAIGQLATSLAHEIRNPLGSIRGAVDILNQPQTSDELHREIRAIIEKECARLERLLANLLDFARPRSPECREIDISQSLEATAALLAHTAAKNRITLRQDVSPGLPSVECDPDQIKQAILNLALNAIQAMPEGGEIVLSARLEGSQILIEVRDHGQGIAAEHLDKLYEPFFTTKGNGTGLGLAIAHQIVTQHQGTMSARKNEDQGMTFSVLLPLQRRRVA